METDTNIQMAEEPINQDKRPRKGAIFIVSVVLGIIAALSAWAALMFEPLLSFWLSVVGIVFSIVGLWVGKCCWRDISITALLASIVLLIVHMIFYFAVDYALSSI